MHRFLSLVILPMLGWVNPLSAQEDLTVAISLDIPPYIQEAASSGLQIDIIREALPDRQVTFKQMPYAQLEMAVSEGKTPVSAGVREKKAGVAYSRNFVTFVNTAISKKTDDLNITNVKDLAAHPVITWENADKDLGEAFEKLFGPGGAARPHYHEVANQQEQVRRFWEEEGAVIVIDRAIFDTFSRELGRDLDRVAYHDLFAPVTAFRVAFKDPALRDAFNAGLKQLCESGRYDALLKKYNMQPNQTICGE